MDQITTSENAQNGPDDNSTPCMYMCIYIYECVYVYSAAHIFGKCSTCRVLGFDLQIGVETHTPTIVLFRAYIP